MFAKKPNAVRPELGRVALGMFPVCHEAQLLRVLLSGEPGAVQDSFDDGISSMDLNHILRKIQTDRSNLRHGRLLSRIVRDPTLAQRCRGSGYIIRPCWHGSSQRRKHGRAP